MQVRKHIQVSQNIGEIISRISNCQHDLDLSYLDFSFTDESHEKIILKAIEERAIKELKAESPLLQSVDLSNCKIYGRLKSHLSREEVNILGLLLSALSNFNITSLNLSCGSLNSLSQNLNQHNLILPNLAKLKTLISLDISNNSLQDMYGGYPKKKMIASGHAIYEAIQPLPLKNLKMRGINCGYSSNAAHIRLLWSKLIESILENHPTLNTLDLSGSDFCIYKDMKNRSPFSHQVTNAHKIRNDSFTLILNKSALFIRPTYTNNFLYSYNCLKFLSLINAEINIDNTIMEKHLDVVTKKLQYIYNQLKDKKHADNSISDSDITVGHFDSVYIIEPIKWDGSKGFQLLCAIMSFNIYKAAKKFSLTNCQSFEMLSTCTVDFLNPIPFENKIAIINDYPDNEFVAKVVNSAPIPMKEKLQQWVIARAARQYMVFIQAIYTEINSNHPLRVLSYDVLLHIFSYLLPSDIKSSDKVVIYNNIVLACNQRDQFFKRANPNDAFIGDVISMDRCKTN